MILRKLFMCWWGGCGMATRADEMHIWGECLRCGKRAGLISREAVRRYLDAEARRKDFLREQAKILEGKARRRTTTKQPMKPGGWMP